MTNIPEPHSSFFSFHLEKGQSSAEPRADSLKTPLTPPPPYISSGLCHPKNYPASHCLISNSVSLSFSLFWSSIFFSYPPPEAKVKIFPFLLFGGPADNLVFRVCPQFRKLLKDSADSPGNSGASCWGSKCFAPFHVCTDLKM